jgi:hypothetical protein
MYRRTHDVLVASCVAGVPAGNVAGSRPVPVTTMSAPISASATAVALPIPRRRVAPNI